MDNNTNNYKFIVVNKITGECFISDNYQKSIALLRHRIFSFAEVTSKAKKFYGNSYILVQLSYKNNNQWQSKQVTKYVQEVIKLVGRENVYDYAWVLEIKPIGRNLHYHLAMHVKPKVFIPYPDKSGMWKWGSSNLYRGESSPYYLAKYVSKESQKYIGEYPKGARKYSTWLNKEYYSQVQILNHRKSAYPAIVSDKISDLGAERVSIKRKKGGGWNIYVLDEGHSLGGQVVSVKSPWMIYKKIS